MLLTQAIRDEMTGRISAEDFYVTRLEIVRTGETPVMDSPPKMTTGVVTFDSKVFLNIIKHPGWSKDDGIFFPERGILIPDPPRIIEMVYSAKFSFVTVSAKVNIAIRISPNEPVGTAANIRDDDFQFCADLANSLQLGKIAAYLMREQAKLIGVDVQLAGNTSETGIQA